MIPSANVLHSRSCGAEWRGKAELTPDIDYVRLCMLITPPPSLCNSSLVSRMNRRQTVKLDFVIFKLIDLVSDFFQFRIDLDPTIGISYHPHRTS